MPTAQNGSPRAAGIRDVARMAGVSVASASFALNGQPGVADDTRRRILAIAEQLGYRANPQAQALRRGRTTTYGFVVRNFANPFFLEVLSGAEEVAGEAGATLLVLDSRYSLERERRHLQEMAAQRLAGLAIAPVGTGESIRLWHDLRPGAPVVALNASAARITGVSPGPPGQRRRGRVAAAPAGRAGAHLGGVPDRAAPADGGPGPAAPLPAAEPGARAAGHRGVLAADHGRRAAGHPGGAGRPDAPTAVITNSDYTAHAVYKAARELGLRIGPGVSVVGHDDLATSELLDPPLATIWLNRREMGRALMLRLLERVPRATTWPPSSSSSGLPCRRRPPARRGSRAPRLPGRPQPACLGVLPPGEHQLAPARQLGNDP